MVKITQHIAFCIIASSHGVCYGHAFKSFLIGRLLCLSVCLSVCLSLYIYHHSCLSDPISVVQFPEVRNILLMGSVEGPFVSLRSVG